MRVALETELETIEGLIVDEADLVLSILRNSIESLRHCDVQLADSVIEYDDGIDAMYMEIRTGIETLLARQTPVAADLRLVLAMLEVNMHLERMADYCVTIAKHTKLTCDLNSDEDLIALFAEMSEQAARMIDVALRGFRERDVAAAESLVELDQVINRANRKVVGRVLDLGGDEQLREWGLRMIIVSRCLERIGDHAVDIGEQAAFLVTGEFREFTDASQD